MRTTNKHFFAALLMSAAGVAQAHPGHGQAALSHWHASDAWGWAIGLAGALAVAWWLRRK